MNKTSNDPFSRGMGGLLLNGTGSAGMTSNNNADPFAGLLGSSLLFTIDNNQSNGQSLMGLGFNNQGTSSSLGGMNMGSGMGGFNQPTLQPLTKPGILSNPNLTIKSTQKQDASKSNSQFNEFDLL